jgi:hypothetical protein
MKSALLSCLAIALAGFSAQDRQVGFTPPKPKGWTLSKSEDHAAKYRHGKTNDQAFIGKGMELSKKATTGEERREELKYFAEAGKGAVLKGAERRKDKTVATLDDTAIVKLGGENGKTEAANVRMYVTFDSKKGKAGHVVHLFEVMKAGRIYGITVYYEVKLGKSKEVPPHVTDLLAELDKAFAE